MLKTLSNEELGSAETMKAAGAAMPNHLSDAARVLAVVLMLPSL